MKIMVKRLAPNGQVQDAEVTFTPQQAGLLVQMPVQNEIANLLVPWDVIRQHGGELAHEVSPHLGQPSVAPRRRRKRSGAPAAPPAVATSPGQVQIPPPPLPTATPSMQAPPPLPASAAPPPPAPPPATG